MTGTVRLAVAALSLVLAARPAAAQEFQPPSLAAPAARAEGGGIRLGVFGFSTRAGGQINRGGQVVVGSTVDIATLSSQQVRLRPSFEVGFAQGVHSLHAALEVVYRFQPDDAPSIPYFGVGVGYYDNGDSTKVRVWPNLVMGFELPFRPTFNWLFEYHALDRLGQHRFLIGLATRGTERN